MNRTRTTGVDPAYHHHATTGRFAWGMRLARTRWTACARPTDQPRLLVEYLGRTAASHPDPYIRWTCSGLDRYFRGADDGSVDATFTVENLPTFLVRGNPVVALARDVAALGDADLLLGALHELFDPASLPRWGVELTLARGCFDLAPEYLRGLSPADLEELAPVVESTWRQRDRELDDQSKELSAMRATLEPTSEDLELAGELAAFAEARATRALDRARDHLDAARGHLGVLGESQRRRRESAANTLADVVREGVVRIVRTRGKEPADAAAFLSAVLARSGKLSVEELEELALLVQEHVEGCAAAPGGLEVDTDATVGEGPDGVVSEGRAQEISAASACSKPAAPRHQRR